MPIVILGNFDRKQLYCAGSVTKLLTTFVTLSLLAEKNHDLTKVLDDEKFFDSICTNSESKSFLQLFQKIIGSTFTLRDVCSFYTGLPYTFDPDESALEAVDAGKPFKHHSVPDEKTFLQLCSTKITPIYRNRKKFHYSEISIMFLGYVIEKIYNTQMETLYEEYIIKKFKLVRSQFSRVKPKDVFVQDLTDKYDYAAAAIQDHGYFCYGNGFYTTLDEMKILLENLMKDSVFQYMVDVKFARAASETLMNGLTIELRMLGDKLVFGYDGVSFSGCNVWAYSPKTDEGYITFCNSTEEADVYSQLGFVAFDKVPAHTKKLYADFAKDFTPQAEAKEVPVEYQGRYQRVKMNEKELKNIFVLGKNFLKIRDPEDIQYDLIYVNKNFHIKGDDQMPEAKIGLHQTKSGNRYMFYNGTLFRRIKAEDKGVDLYPTTAVEVRL